MQITHCRVFPFIKVGLPPWATSAGGPVELGEVSVTFSSSWQCWLLAEDTQFSLLWPLILQQLEWLYYMALQDSASRRHGGSCKPLEPQALDLNSIISTAFYRSKQVTWLTQMQGDGEIDSTNKRKLQQKGTHTYIKGWEEFVTIYQSSTWGLHWEQVGNPKLRHELKQAIKRNRAVLQSCVDIK